MAGEGRTFERRRSRSECSSAAVRRAPKGRSRGFAKHRFAPAKRPARASAGLGQERSGANGPGSRGRRAIEATHALPARSAARLPAGGRERAPTRPSGPVRRGRCRKNTNVIRPRSARVGVLRVGKQRLPTLRWLKSRWFSEEIYLQGKDAAA